jgi:hypothetical protein
MTMREIAMPPERSPVAGDDRKGGFFCNDSIGGDRHAAEKITGGWR